MTGRLLTAVTVATSLFSLAPRTAAQEAPAGLRQLGFMAGCWEGLFEVAGQAGVIEEHYTSPSTNLMLGTTRYLVEGAATGFEFSRIERTGTEIVLTPYPRGVASAHGFRLTQAGDDEAVFEAPRHDFPKRIHYRREPGGALVARIDGGQGSEKSAEWRMTPAACSATDAP
ncbi:MAG: DUF6265 family protein [Gemmatimonadota bacterium]